MPHDRIAIEEEALGWVIRLRAPDFDAWEEYEAWLGADPRHADVYHEMAVADQDMAELLAAPVPRPIIAPAPMPPGRRAHSRIWWAGGALAASLAAVIGVQMIDRTPSLVRIETKPGELRTVQLSEGSSVTLNGATRIALDRDDPRHVELERGEAAFAVVHDEARPFEVKVGGATLLDVGTRFNVVRDGGVTSVEVAEGAVLYNPDKEKVQLSPGQTLRVADKGGAITLGRIRPALIGEWQTGQLIYENRPIEEVVADLQRWSRQDLRLSSRLAGRRFSGAIDLRSARDVGDLAPVLDVKADRSAGGWILSPRP